MKTLILLLLFGCASKPPKPYIPQFEAKAPIIFQKGPSPLLVNIDDRRTKTLSPPTGKMIKYLKSSLKNIYGENIQWVELDNAIPEKAYVEILIKKMHTTLKSRYWTGESAVSLKLVDRRVFRRKVEKNLDFRGNHKKFNVPWEDTQNEVLKKSWEKISGNILKGLNNFFEKP